LENQSEKLWAASVLLSLGGVEGGEEGEDEEIEEDEANIKMEERMNRLLVDKAKAEYSAPAAPVAFLTLAKTRKLGRRKSPFALF